MIIYFHHPTPSSANTHRDFNTPKIVADDTPVFLGLISDLFPNLDVPRKRLKPPPFNQMLILMLIFLPRKRLKPTPFVDLYFFSGTRSLRSQ